MAEQLKKNSPKIDPEMLKFLDLLIDLDALEHENDWNTIESSANESGSKSNNDEIILDEENGDDYE